MSVCWGLDLGLLAAADAATDATRQGFQLGEAMWLHRRAGHWRRGRGRGCVSVAVSTNVVLRLRGSSLPQSVEALGATHS